MLNLIIDRTAQDAIAGTEKGKYNATDLNRVGAAIEYVAGRLRSCGFDVSVAPKTDWIMADIPTAEQLTHYLDEVQLLRNALAVFHTTPAVPESMENLTHSKANDIEKILVDVDQLITNMIAAYFYSGELYGGEV